MLRPTVSKPWFSNDESDITAKIGTQGGAIIVTAPEMPVRVISNSVCEVECKLADWKETAFQRRDGYAGAGMSMKGADDAGRALNTAL